MYRKTVAAFCAAFTLSAVTTVNAQRQSRIAPIDKPGSTVSLTDTFPSGPATSISVDGSLAGSPSCPLFILPNDNSTSGNARAPSTAFAASRAVYLITPAEAAAAGFTNGVIPTTIGWTYTNAGQAGSAPLTIFMQNTADTTYTKGTDWATAITGMTTVHSATTAIPATAGSFDITMSGGSSFTYTGGGIYVAYDWGPYVGTLAPRTTLCNSAGLPGGLAGANSAAATLAVSAFRPETRMNGVALTDDLTVSHVYSLGELRFCGVPAQVIQAVVLNRGSDTKTNVNVSLNISGVDAFTDNQNIASITGCGGLSVVTFAAFAPTTAGNNTVTVLVPNDSNNANNSLARPMNNTPLDTSYKYPGSTAAGGVGFTNGQGAFVAKFATTGGDTITAVKLEFFAATATAYRVAIYGDSIATPGTPFIGAPLYLDAADRTVVAPGPVTITLDSPLAVPAGNFYVGLHQMNVTNANFSFDNENPIRAGAFFFSAFVPPANPTAWTNFAPGTNFKLNVGYVGSNCEVLGACCTEGGGCTPNLSSAACSGIEGTWNEGADCTICTTPPCTADTNNDGQVNVTDLLAVISGWGTPCSVCTADINNDGNVNVTDLLAVISNWGICD